MNSEVEPAPHRTASQSIPLRHPGAKGEVLAEVELVGGGLRALSLGGVDLIETYPEDRRPPFCAGAVLFPWPNRVRSGNWTQRGVSHELPNTEPALGNANHGLVLDQPFTLERRTPDTVDLAASVGPQPGYPFQVTLRLMYRLTYAGIEVDVEVTNESSWPAPVAFGAHPYLRIGDCPTAELALQVAAHTRIEVDEQLIPVRVSRVAGSDLDFRQPRRIGNAELNTCLGDIDLVDGRRRIVLAAPDGREVELWASADFGYVQIYTCPQYPRAEGDTRSLAIEPMTAPADALNSGTGLLWLAPEEVASMSWGISGRL